MMAAASLITAPLAGAAEVPDVPAMPIPAAISIAIKMVRIGVSIMASLAARTRKDDELVLR
jgi:hypothetical protein